MPSVVYFVLPVNYDRCRLAVVRCLLFDVCTLSVVCWVAMSNQNCVLLDGFG